MEPNKSQLNTSHGEGGGFRLHGSHESETRLLVHQAHGYALAVPGHPRFVSHESDFPRYDAVLALANSSIEIGVRIDEMPTTLSSEKLVASLAMAYASARAVDLSDARVGGLDGPLLAPGAEAGVRVNYQLRGPDPDAMEFLVVTAKSVGASVRALYLTVRYRRGETTPFEWASLRAVLLNHQSWNEIDAVALEVWPTSAFAAPSIKLQLSPSSDREAQAKAIEVGELTPDEADQLADILLEAATTDDPPTIEMPSFVLDMFTRRVASCVPSRAAEILLRDLSGVRTMHDFRAWCWECYWAVGNRSRDVEQ